MKVIFSTNFRPKTKKIRAKKSVWFWANLKRFSQISLNQEFFSKIWLCHFSTFIVPFMEKFRKILRAISEKTALPTNEPVITNNTHFIGPDWCQSNMAKSFILSESKKELINEKKWLIQSFQVFVLEFVHLDFSSLFFYLWWPFWQYFLVQLSVNPVKMI